MQAPDQADPFDALLTRAFTTEPSAGSLAAMDARVAEALARRPNTPALSRPPRLRLPRRRTIAALALAAVVLGGAGMSVLGGFWWITLDPSFRVAWERGTQLEMSTEIDGYRVTLHRAYADANQLVIALSAEDVADHGHRQVSTLLGGFHVEGDGEYTGAGAISRPIDRFAATDVYRRVRSDPGPPPARGHFVVTVDAVVAHDGTTAPPDDTGEWMPWRPVAGPFVFEFDLPIAGGTTPVDVGLTAEHDGTSLLLEALRFSPTVIQAQIRVTQSSVSASFWSPIMTMSRGSETFSSGLGRIADDLQAAEVLTVSGVDDPSGEWTVTVTELVGDTADGQVRLQGPWVFHVTVP